MKKYYLTLCCLLISAGIGACGPIYSTDYSFTPPKSGGTRCIEVCEDYEKICTRNMEWSKEQCEYDNRTLMDECSDRIQREKNRAPKWTECGRQLACDYPVSRCEADYRACYSDCGGTVKEIKTCIANCEPSK